MISFLNLAHCAYRCRADGLVSWETIYVAHRSRARGARGARNRQGPALRVGLRPVFRKLSLVVGPVRPHARRIARSPPPPPEVGELRAHRLGQLDGRPRGARLIRGPAREGWGNVKPYFSNFQKVNGTPVPVAKRFIAAPPGPFASCGN